MELYAIVFFTEFDHYFFLLVIYSHLIRTINDIE